MRAATWKMLFTSVAICLTIGVGSLASLALAAEGDGENKPKMSIKDVMKVAHAKDTGLISKVLSGEASDKDKKALLDAYIDLIENAPTKGDMDSWQRLAGGAALAAAKVVVGREGALEELKTATNCKACHSVHKGN